MFDSSIAGLLPDGPSSLSRKNQSDRVACVIALCETNRGLLELCSLQVGFLRKLGPDLTGNL